MPDTKQTILWQPWPGPQTHFLAATEDEVLFGGAKGPGKSDAILYGALRQVDKPLYKALILRRSFPELIELMDRAQRVFPRITPRPTWHAADKRWVFASGAIVAFGFCETIVDVGRYQGQEWSYIGYDELGNLAEEDVWVELSKEVRSPDPTIQRMMRASANPGGPGHPWIKRRFVDPCGRDGERIVTDQYILPPDGIVATRTRRYIPARVTDNPIYANDPKYMATLHALPEVLKRQLLYGDWDAGFGSAFPDLSPPDHLIQPFDVPDRWVHFGAFDWGYAHPWVFGHFATNEDGTVFLVNSAKGRHMMPEAIAERILNTLGGTPLRVVWAGHDCWADIRSRGDFTPTIAETLQQLGLPLAHANLSRRAGLQTMRDYISFAGRGPDGQDLKPRFLVMDTPTNQWVFEQLRDMTIDPDDPEDVLKRDANTNTGLGGDDGYDMVRYGLTSRPTRGARAPEAPLRAWDPAVLAHEAERRRRPSPQHPKHRPSVLRGAPDAWEIH